MVLPQAELVAIDRHRGYVGIAYKIPLDKDQQAELSQLLRGLYIRQHDYVMTQLRENEELTDFFVARVWPLDGVITTRLMAGIKEVTRPVLAILLQRLLLRVEQCSCGEHGAATPEFLFAPGFRPDDVESFKRAFYAQLIGLNTRELLKDHNELQKALMAALRSIGAYTQDITVDTRRTDIACKHQSLN